MEIKNSFEVPLPPADTWRVLMDIPRIAPCMPGAELTEQVDERTFKGKVAVKLGPVALSFAGTANFDEIDEDAHRARVKAQGADAKGRGGASATVNFQLAPTQAGTRVDVLTDIALSGSVAQYGRGSGIIQSVATQLVGQFAERLRLTLAADKPAANHTAPVAKQADHPLPPAKPISMFSLVAKALWNSMLRLFGRGSRET
jgi:carbon monoxide dehydrogenase subunit G